MPWARWLVVLFPGWRIFAVNCAAVIGVVSCFSFIDLCAVLASALFDPGKTPPASAPRPLCRRRQRWVDRLNESNSTAVAAGWSVLIFGDRRGRPTILRIGGETEVAGHSDEGSTMSVSARHPRKLTLTTPLLARSTALSSGPGTINRTSRRQMFYHCRPKRRIGRRHAENEVAP